MQTLLKGTLLTSGSKPSTTQKETIIMESYRLVVKKGANVKGFALTRSEIIIKDGEGRLKAYLSFYSFRDASALLKRLMTQVASIITG